MASGVGAVAGSTALGLGEAKVERQGHGRGQLLTQGSGKQTVGARKGPGTRYSPQDTPP